MKYIVKWMFGHMKVVVNLRKKIISKEKRISFNQDSDDFGKLGNKISFMNQH